MRTLVIQISGMHCISCALNIDFELEDLSGVKESKTNYVRQHTVVSFDPGQVSDAQIIAVIKKLGYEAAATG